jgi:hypothetical protein
MQEKKLSGPKAKNSMSAFKSVSNEANKMKSGGTENNPFAQDHGIKYSQPLSDYESSEMSAARFGGAEKSHNSKSDKEKHSSLNNSSANNSLLKEDASFQSQNRRQN